MYTCDICEKGFMNPKGLNAHKGVHVLRGEKNYSCDICNTAFSRSSEFYTHKKLYHNQTEKPYSCNLCDISCETNYALTQHKRKHTGEKPFSCNTCNKSFARVAKLNEHKKTRLHMKRKENASKIKIQSSPSNSTNNGEDSIRELIEDKETLDDDFFPVKDEAHK